MSAEQALSVPPRLLTIAEVADLLGVHHETVYRAVWEERLRAVKIGRVLRITVDAYRDYVASSAYRKLSR